MWEKISRRRTMVWLVLAVLALAVSASAIAMVPEGDDDAADVPTEEAIQNPTTVASPTKEAVKDPTSVTSPTEVVVHQDATAAFEQDAALLATQAGMSVEEAEQIFSFQDAFADFTEEYVFPRYEDQISAIWPDLETSTGYIRFVGEVPDDVASEAARRGLTVVVSGGGDLSMAQQRSRSDLAAQALADAGYRPFIIAPDFKHGVIKIELNIPESEPVPDKTTIADLIAAKISSNPSGLEGRAAKIHPRDIDLNISITDEPMVILDEDPTGQNEESPLATWDPSQNSYFHAARGGEGPLVFEDGCVFVKNPNGSLVLPIWPEPTSWDPDTETINYVSPVRNLQDENAMLHEGDIVELGGSSGPIEPSLLVRPPADHCVERADWSFIVSGIEVASTSSIEDTPLATWDPSGRDAFEMAIAGQGELEISKGCVLVVSDSGLKILPVWPEPTSWDAATQTIKLVGPMKDMEGSRADLQAGDHVALAGTIKGIDFSSYITPPTPECAEQADEEVIVSGISTGDGS